MAADTKIEWAHHTFNAWIKCADAGTAFHFKQWGEWSAMGPHNCDMLIGADGVVGHPRYAIQKVENPGKAGLTIMTRIGKKAAGRLLAGVQHDGVPT